MRASRVLVPLAAAFLVAAPPALGAAPANDDRAGAAALSAADDVRGTTVGATREANDPRACPTEGGATVWYRYTAPSAGVARIALTTSGGLDASLAVYAVENSTITRVACADTRRGTAYGSFDVEAGRYLVRVAERRGSAPGPFRLRFSGVLEEPAPPGRPLGADGNVSGSLNPLLRPFAQLSRTLRSAVAYRVRVAVGRDPGACSAGVRLLAPDGEVFRTLGCRDYAVVTPTPEQAGPWTVALAADLDGLAAQPYRVSITPARPDDLAPGRPLGAFGTVRASVDGRGPDAQDVFRVDVDARAELTLELRATGSMRVLLLSERGRRITSATVDDGTAQIRTRVRPGRFYAVVDAARGTGGTYTLRRLTRVITATTVTFNGSAAAEQGPGGSATVGVHVAGASGGRAAVVLERFDPQFGWRFSQERTLALRDGRAAFTVAAAELGRYRARAAFLGTREAGPSRARRSAELRVR